MGGGNSVFNKPLGTGNNSLGSSIGRIGKLDPFNITGMHNVPEKYEGISQSALYQPGGAMIESELPGGYQAVTGGINRYGEVRPDHLLLRGEDGKLNENFTSTMGESYSALKDKAMATGDTKSAMLARQAQEQMRQADVDRMRGMQASGVTQGMRNLAMRGGVATGSRERLMKDATRTGMRGMQGIGRENRMANLQISQADEAMKNQLLQGIGGVEQNIQNQNIKLLAQDIAAQNMAAQNMYGEDMKALGAIETGKAQANAGKSSGGLFK